MFKPTMFNPMKNHHLPGFHDPSQRITIPPSRLRIAQGDPALGAKQARAQALLTLQMDHFGAANQGASRVGTVGWLVSSVTWLENH